MSADQAMRRAAVLGHPVGHSLSPVIHLEAYRILGLPWGYDRVDVASSELVTFVTSLGPEWVGLSLTMPLKAEVLPLLDARDPLVDATGAANTVVFDDGTRVGYNTDVIGLVRALRERGLGQTPRRSTILGGGATARSAIAALAELGAQTIEVCLRRPDASAELLATAGAVGVELVVGDLLTVSDSLSADVVISTLPTGVADSFVRHIPASAGVLLDVVYAPWPTTLATAWVQRGGTVASGLDLLLHQAVEQVRLMTGAEVSAQLLRPALEAAAATR
ncbi:MAG: shikimate dehydrogenase [Actinomycetes bacterium]